MLGRFPMSQLKVTESEKEKVCRPRRQRQLPTRYRSDSETRTMVCCASFVTTMNLKNCHLKWYSGQTVMFVELGYTPTVLLAPIRSPANLNVKIVGQIFLSFCFFSEHCGIF